MATNKNAPLHRGETQAKNDILDFNTAVRFDQTLRDGQRTLTKSIYEKLARDKGIERGQLIQSARRNGFTSANARGAIDWLCDRGFAEHGMIQGFVLVLWRDRQNDE